MSIDQGSLVGKTRGVRWAAIALGCVASAVLLARIILPERGLDVTGWRALYDLAFAITLTLAVVIVGFGAGHRIARAFSRERPAAFGSALLSIALGLGALAYGIFGLGLVGLFSRWALVGWVLALGLWSRREIVMGVEGVLGEVTRLGARWRTLPNPQRLVLVVCCALGSMALLQALAPPWDYDGLMYHLQGPRLFLDAGRVLLLPENWQANGPFTVEMVFGLGLSLGSDTFAKLIHTTFAVLLVVSTFALGRRAFGNAGGWVSIALIAGVPLLGFWASLAYVDMAWALFQTLMFLCLVRWDGDHQREGVILAGVFAGLAAGCKYLGLGAAALGGLWLIGQLRYPPWRTALKSAALFGGLAAGVALPWYVKNWVMSGNPVFPFLVGGPGWDAERLRLLMDYLYSFGTGHTPLDYMLLPWNLFARSGAYGTFMRALEVPNVLLVLGLLYPLGRRTRVADSIAALAGGGFLLWALGTQQTRFLLALLPALAVTSSGFILRIADWTRPRWWARAAGMVVLAIPVALAVFWSGFLVWYASPAAVVFGVESKQAFLQRRVPDFRALRFVAGNVPAAGRVLMLWDGQGYYCDARCLPDTDQSVWPRLAAGQPEPAELAAELRAAGVTHLLYSRDSDVFVEERDRRGLHRASRDYLLGQFLPQCASEVYRDEWVELYELHCPAPG